MKLNSRQVLAVTVRVNNCRVRLIELGKAIDEHASPEKMAPLQSAVRHDALDAIDQLRLFMTRLDEPSRKSRNQSKRKLRAIAGGKP